MRSCIALVLLLVAANAAAADFAVRVAPFGQVFPALELSQSRRAEPAQGDHVLGSGSGLIAVRVRARHAGERVVLGINVPGLGPTQHFAATLAQGGVEYSLHPPLHWNRENLRAIVAPRTVSMRFDLRRDAGPTDSQTVSVSLRPPDEALYFVRDAGDSVDLSWIFAAYVDARDPIVTYLLEDARRHGIVDAFDGYADADPDRVLAQVWAIWDAIGRRGIRYSGADPAIERGPHVYSQRVRSLARTWADRSANCIDGSVLIASALQRIGLRTFLVLVPGHAFVGFYTDTNGRHVAYLETTLLGANVGAPQTRPAFATRTAANDGNLASFVAALAAGRARHAHVARKLDGRHRPDYAVIDIDAARAYGIVPIAAGQTGDGAIR
jgi:hypothetical protein